MNFFFKIFISGALKDLIAPPAPRQSDEEIRRLWGLSTPMFTELPTKAFGSVRERDISELEMSVKNVFY